MQVFKFGGASVKDAAAVKNVADILSRYREEQLVVVVSAMGKMTNAFESLCESYWKGESTEQKMVDILDFHSDIVVDLFPQNNDAIQTEIREITGWLRKKCASTPSDNYDYEYDQIVSLGEVLSTKIIATYLSDHGYATEWVDAREIIRTNNRYREAKIDWEKSENLVQERLLAVFNNGTQVAITQGFLGHTAEGFTTTLGREGSDFTAAIMAYILEADDVTIWKDVPGMLNADPKYFDHTVLLEKISFREAIELAYFGASVIHPRTIQPLKRKGIPLYIRSFVHPDATGSVIQESTEFDNQIPSFIFKMDQLLISMTPRDFSFIMEENLEEIFAYLNRERIRMNIMQNSAVSFSFCVDRTKIDFDAFQSHFGEQYLIRYNEEMELVTIRHYDDETLERLLMLKKVYLEQKSRETARLVIKNI